MTAFSVNPGISPLASARVAEIFGELTFEVGPDGLGPAAMMGEALVSATLPCCLMPEPLLHSHYPASPLHQEPSAVLV